MKKHILVISQYFYPEEFRINDMCKEWVKKGYEVTVVTGIPNYPIGRFFDGYGLFKNRYETLEGIKIIRLPITARGKGKLSLVANYFSFVLSGYFWHLLTKVRADLVFTFEVSPMTQALIGVWYAKKYRRPHYLYVQDLWPENVQTVMGINNKLVITPIDKMVDYIYKHSHKIFATSPSFVESIINRSKPVNAKKVYYWPQYAEDFYQPLERSSISEIPDDNSFKIVFTGNIGYAQGLEILPQLAKKLEKEKIKFVIVGDGRYKEELISQIREQNLTNKFILIPRQPAKAIPAYLATCDAAFLSFMDTDLFSKTIPAKLQSYLACGKPIIAAASGEVERIITEANCGVCAPIGDVNLLAEKIRVFKNADLKTMGHQARQYFEQHFSRSVLMDEMEDHFKEMLPHESSTD